MKQNESGYISRNNQQQYTTMEDVGQPENQPATIYKRIGSTNYRVRVHFSETSCETMNDKILRMVRNEAAG